MKKDEVYLRHVLDAIAQIEAYTAGVEAGTFLAEPMRQDATARQLEIIGEATRRLPEAFREAHPEVPWRTIVGLRNRIAHDYMNVDVQVLWEIVRDDLPALQAQVQTMLGEEPTP